MKFKFLLKNSIKVAITIISALILLGLGFMIYRLAVFGTDAFNIVSLVFAIIVLIMLALLIFNTHYTFTEDCLKVSLGFIVQKIRYNDILMIKNYVNAKELFILFRPINAKTEDTISQIMINIKPELYTDFVEALKSKNNQIVYDEVNSRIEDDEQANN